MSTSMKKLVLIGDSIRMGYENEVKKLLADKVEIFAPVENGGNSRKIKSKPRNRKQNAGRLSPLKR